MTLTTSIVKQWPIQTLNVPGAELMTSPVFTDHRGTLYESFHILKFRTTCSIASAYGVYPPRKVVYGPISLECEEYVYIIRGKLFVVLIDLSNFETRDTLSLIPGQILRIPAFSIRGFLSLEDDTVFVITRTSANFGETKYDFADARLAIPWPESDLVPESSLRRTAPVEPSRPQFAIFGANGVIGSSFVEYFKANGIQYYEIRSQLKQQEAIRNEIGIVKPTVSVLVDAGGDGGNEGVVGRLAITSNCEALKIHCTLIGTAVGGIQKQGEIENLLNKTGVIATVLNLRAASPIDGKVIGELVKAKQASQVPVSWTVLPELVPLAVELIKGGEVGDVNWACRGVMSSGDILRAYKEIVDPDLEINEVQDGDKGGLAAVETERLIAKFGEDRIPEVRAAIGKVITLIKGT